MMVNKAGSIKNDMVMNMVLVNVGADDIFIFPFLVFRQQILLPSLCAVSASTSPGLKD